MLRYHKEFSRWLFSSFFWFFSSRQISIWWYAACYSCRIYERKTCYWRFLDHLTCKDRSILVDIVDIVQIHRTGRIGRPHQDSCCCEMRSWSILPQSLSHRDSATYNLSNHFRIKTPSLLSSKICLNLACSRGTRQHLWSLSGHDQILSFGEQTGRTWFFIVMTDFWHK